MVKPISRKYWHSFLLVALLCPMLMGARNVRVSGSARVTFATGIANVRKAQIVSPGYQVITRRSGRVVLAFANGHRLRIGPNSSVRLVKYNAQKRRTLVHVKKGRVWNKVNARKRHRVAIRTRHTTAAVLGTAYEVNAGESQTETQVFEGSVAIRRPGEEAAENLFDQMPALSHQPETTTDSNAPFQAPTEVASPVHEVPAPMKVVPGPYEVSKDQWLQLVANQKISMSADGKANIQMIDPVQLQSADEWVRWNRTMDAKFTEVRDDKE